MAHQNNAFQNHFFDWGVAREKERCQKIVLMASSNLLLISAPSISFPRRLEQLKFVSEEELLAKSWTMPLPKQHGRAVEIFQIARHDKDDRRQLRTNTPKI